MLTKIISNVRVTDRTTGLSNDVQVRFSNEGRMTTDEIEAEAEYLACGDSIDSDMTGIEIVERRTIGKERRP